MNQIEIAGITMVFDHKATLVAVDVGSGWHTLVGADAENVLDYLGDRAPLGIRGEISLTDFLCAIV
ncbi:MAG: hypothetical protein EBT18_11385 [Gammaproteobacteria bacterium]|nr:hypothetical protein [Gammaproteobacteria bacterium]